MRRLWVVAAIAALPLFADAKELNRGTLALSGSTELSFGSTTVEIEGVPEELDSDFRSVQVAGLYYLTPQFGIGAFVDHERDETDVGAFRTESSTTLIGPAVGLNVSLSDKLSLYGTLGVGIARLSQDDDDLEGFAWEVGAGLALFPIDQVSFNVGLSYGRVDVENDLDRNIESSGLAFGVGLSVYFGS